MNDIAVGQRRRRHGLSAAAAVAMALLAAACSSGSSSSAGSGGSSNAGGSSSSPSAVAFSACMRSRGVPNFPDPLSSGDFPTKADPQVLGVSSSQLRAAQQACQQLFPYVSGPLTALSFHQCEEAGVCPPALVQQALTQLRKFARCMRSHGLPNWPDPTTDSQGRPGFAISVSKLGFDPESSQGDTKVNECEHVEHPVLGTPLE